MPEMHFRQPEFTWSACWPFTKNKERIKKGRKKKLMQTKQNMSKQGQWFLQLINEVIVSR